ncbi:MAG: lysylphosphatidylglycerol synthase transmembrane domain-containing protein [candidate division Zixibacteria bacterium]|nr:lysylphosphatidylglycerol synthase transmembrane domain-containing protein [candidate division Zixibacteria bacterium]
MNQRDKKMFYLIVGGAISIIFLWGLFYNINLKELGRALKEANYYWLIPNIALIVFTMYQRAYRWQIMMSPIKVVAYRKLLSATCIGFMANNVLPLRLGEFVRAYSISNQDKEVTKSASLATIFVERMVFDLVALLIIFGGVFTIAHPILGNKFNLGLVLALSVAFAGILFMLVLAMKPAKSGKLIVRYLPFLPSGMKERVESTIIKFSRGFEFIKSPKKLAGVGVQTAFIWLVMGVSNYFVFLAFNFDLPLSASFVLLVTVSLSILIPSSPGFIGVYHAAVTLTLSIYKISAEQALSFALVLHAAQYIPITLLGFYYLKKEHLSLKELEEEATEDL